MGINEGEEWGEEKRGDRDAMANKLPSSHQDHWGNSDAAAELIVECCAVV